MPESTTTMTAHVRQHLGRHLAALYDGLPPAPVGPQLEALLQQLQASCTGTPTKPGR